MTAEFPPPDARLAGKVKVVQFSARATCCASRQTAIGTGLSCNRMLTAKSAA